MNSEDLRREISKHRTPLHHNAADGDTVLITNSPFEGTPFARCQSRLAPVGECLV